MLSHPFGSRDDRRNLLLHGRPEPPARPTTVRVEEMAAELDGPDLAYVTSHGVEIVRRLYFAVRDTDWGTVTPVVTSLTSSACPIAHRIELEVECRDADIDVHWSVTVSLLPDGIDATAVCTAQTAFEFNRMGFCVLHPPEEFAGRPYTAVHEVGRSEGVLPERVAPQRIVDGVTRGMFPPICGLELHGRSGVRVRFTFEGDLFEMEDQRNWTDASYKTYSTPLALGIPHRIAAGESLTQSVSVRIIEAARIPKHRDEVVAVAIGGAMRERLPSLGFVATQSEGVVDPTVLPRLGAIQPGHLRVELSADNDSEALLASAAHACAELGCDLSIALDTGNDPASGLRRAADALSEVDATVSEVLVLERACGREMSSPPHVRLARAVLTEVCPGARFLCATNAYFASLNRDPLDLEGIDGVAFSIHPQEHMFDDRSVMETLGEQTTVARQARQLAGGRHVAVGPVTLGPRLHGTSVTRGVSTRIDPRQLSLFGAAWTLGSLAALLRTPVDSVTYFETVGPTGLVERSTGSPRPDIFPSDPDQVFPIFHVFCDLTQPGAVILEVRFTGPTPVTALGLAHTEGLILLLANRAPQTAKVAGLPEPPGLIRRLGLDSYDHACLRPEEFRASFDRLPAGGRLSLDPYEYVRVDVPLPAPEA